MISYSFFSLQNSTPTRKSIEKNLKKYYLTLKDLAIYTNYNTGVKNAFESIESIEHKIDGFNKNMHDFEYYTKMFEMEEGTGGV